MQLKQWAPFAQPDFAIIFEADAALVWCWDATWLQTQRAQLPTLWHNAEVMPETVLWAPSVDSMRILRCLDGVEVQYWQNGQLYASRWWAQMPEMQEYIAFCREVGHPVAHLTQVPPAQSAGDQVQPWLPVVTGAGLLSVNPAMEQWLYVLLFLCVTLPYGWYSMRDHQISDGIERNKQAMAQLTGQANSLVQARDAALKAVDEVANRQRLDPYPSQLEMMSAVADALPSDSTIREWEFTENKLRIIVYGGLETPSRADITKTLMSSGYFSEVQNLLARDNKSLSFRMVVLPKKGVSMLQDKPNADGRGSNG